MINFHCAIIPVVVLNSVITHTSAWFLDREIHQLVKAILFLFYSLFFFQIHDLVIASIQYLKATYVHILHMQTHSYIVR